MLLRQLLENDSEMTEEQAIFIVKSYTNGYTRLPQLNQAVEFLYARNIAIIDTLMFRYIVVPGVEVRKNPNTQYLTSLMHQYDLERGHKYFSWATSLRGMIRAMEINYDNDLYGDISMPHFIFVTEQTGKALDINKLLGEDQVVDPEEEELLAPLYNVSIEGFMVVDQFNPRKDFRISQFKEAIQTIRASVQRTKDYNN